MWLRFSGRSETEFPISDNVCKNEHIYCGGNWDDVLDSSNQNIYKSVHNVRQYNDDDVGSYNTARANRSDRNDFDLPSDHRSNKRHHIGRCHDYDLGHCFDSCCYRGLSAFHTDHGFHGFRVHVNHGLGGRAERELGQQRRPNIARGYSAGWSGFACVSSEQLLLVMN